MKGSKDANRLDVGIILKFTKVDSVGTYWQQVSKDLTNEALSYMTTMLFGPELNYELELTQFKLTGKFRPTAVPDEMREDLKALRIIPDSMRTWGQNPSIDFGSFADFKRLVEMKLNTVVIVPGKITEASGGEFEKL